LVRSASRSTPYSTNPVEKEDAAWAVSQAQIFVQAMQITFL